MNLGHDLYYQKRMAETRWEKCYKCGTAYQYLQGHSCTKL